MKIICSCKKGYGSAFDGLCCYCRAGSVRRAELKKIGVKLHEGLTITQYLKLRAEEIGREFLYTPKNDTTIYDYIAERLNRLNRNSKYFSSDYKVRYRCVTSITHGKEHRLVVYTTLDSHTILLRKEDTSFFIQNPEEVLKHFENMMENPESSRR